MRYQSNELNPLVDNDKEQLNSPDIFKAATRNFIFLLILAAPVDKTGTSTTALNIF